MKKNFLFQLLLAAFLLPAFSCSDDDSAPEINNATTLNMLDVENGATRLGNSDIYINDAGNFISPSSCQLFMLGARSGLGAVDVSTLQNPAPEVAVMKGYGYVAVRGVTGRVFPSHNVALPLDPDLNVNYLKFYVMDNIEDAERGTLGAVVKFVIDKPRNYWLPEWDSTPYRLDYSSKNLGEEVSVPLPDENFEVELDSNNDLTCEKQGRNLVFKLLDWPSYDSGYYTLRLRVGESYTQVRMVVIH